MNLFDVENRVSRRQVLSVGLLAAGAALVSACSSSAPASPTAAPATQAPAAQQAASTAANTPAAAGAATATPVAASVAATTGPAATPTTATQPAAQSQPTGATVQLAYWGHNHQPRVKLDNQYLAEMATSQPGIKVDYTVVPDQYEVKLTAAMAAGTGPDMYNLYDAYNMAFITKGFSAPVDPSPWGLPNNNSFDDLYVPGTLEGFKYQGKLYGIPSEVSNYSMFVNTDDVKPLGITVSTDNGTQWTNYPKTWEDLIPVAQKLTRTQGDTITHRGFDFSYSTKQGLWTSPVLSWLGMAYQLGGVPLTPDLKTALIDGDPFVQALQFQYDWIYTHKLGSAALLGSNQAFAQAQNSMSLIGFWAFSSIQTQYPKVFPATAAAPFPQFQSAKNHSGANVYGYAWMANGKSDADKIAAVWKVAKQFSDHGASYIKDAGLLQPKKSLLDDPTYKSLKFIDVFLNDAQGTPYEIRHVNGIEINDALTRALSRTTQEKMAPKDSLSQAKKEIDGIIAKG